MNLDNYSLETLREIRDQLKGLESPEARKFVEDLSDEIKDLQYIEKNYLPWD